MFFINLLISIKLVYNFSRSYIFFYQYIKTKIMGCGFSNSIKKNAVVSNPDFVTDPQKINKEYSYLKTSNVSEKNENSNFFFCCCWDILIFDNSLKLYRYSSERNRKNIFERWFLFSG